MIVVYPYPRLIGEIHLRVDGVVVDNEPLSTNLISETEAVVALHGVPSEWNAVRLPISVRCDTKELSSGPWHSPACVAIVTNSATKIREVFSLVGDGGGVWRGDIELSRTNHRGACTIEALIVAEVGSVIGRSIGSSEQRWRVDFEAKRPTQERSLRMEWRDFTAEGNDELNNDDPWALDAGANEPVLYLNSSIEGFRGLLESAKTAQQEIVRDVLASQISAEVWTALFNAAVYASQPTTDGVVDWPGGWHEDVLRRMLPDLFDDLSPDDALAELAGRRTEGENGGDMQTRLMHAATVQSKKAKNVSDALRDLGRLAEMRGVQ